MATAGFMLGIVAIVFMVDPDHPGGHGNGLYDLN